MLFHSDADRVIEIFEELCSIPHGSGNTAAISAHIAAFAEKLGLPCIRDDANNLIIKKEGTPGYEDHAPVILQGHIDMVCEKAPNVDFDFEKEGLKLRRDGDYLSATNTTLGADNGIAVAYAMALMESKDIPHPPLEIVLTSDEEIGMLGAAALDTTPLKGRTMLNLDSEEEGVFTVGCAGGVRLCLSVPVTRTPVKGDTYLLQLRGGVGGHSGAEIHRGIANAIRVMAQSLSEAEGLRLVSFTGGGKDNAIPSSCEAVFVLPKRMKKDKIVVALLWNIAKHLDTDPKLRYHMERLKPVKEALDETSTRAALRLLTATPDGVQAMSPHIEGLVQTSLNLGVVRLDEAIHATFLVRSSVNREKEALRSWLEGFAVALGGTSEATGDYPAWEYRESSPLRDCMIREYRELTQAEPRVEVIHAGLECGLFSGKLEGLDAVAIGPEMHDIHTPRERISLSSIERTWTFIQRVLKAL